MQIVYLLITVDMLCSKNNETYFKISDNFSSFLDNQIIVYTQLDIH